MKAMNLHKGLSLIELIVVIAIVGVLAAIVVPSFITFRQQQAIQNTTNAVVAVLNDARTKTFAAVNNTSYGVYVATDAVTLFSGTTYSAGATTNEIYTVETPTTLTWSLQDGGATISFDRLKGTTSQYGTIVVHLPNGSTKTVTITALGTIVRN